ncbi:MAG TPA: esterase-like activity of phytase family protein, partial [Candidatus Eisenbacteria bacterium]|nr:esterase-like activity of phytase family protein [Candidatus Eisenbacteria bacterium]
RGHWLAARMVLGPGGVLQDLVDWEIKPLLAPDRSAVQAPLGDAEALAAGLDGSLIVGFEQRSRIWRYPPPPANLASPPVSIQIPPELAEAPKNGGIEALTVLPDGRILVLTEEFENPDGTFKGWLVDGGGRFDALSYQPSDGYHVTDCAALASGDLLVLERRYGIFGDLRSRLKLVPRERIRPGARLTGDELLRLEPPLLTENFEGLAVHENAASGATIYLVSDNNFLPFQRTLLLQFSLPRAR